MSGNYRFKPADLKKITTYSIDERKSLVSADQFSNVKKYGETGRYQDALPSILKANDLKRVVEAIKAAKAAGAPIVAAIGAHLIKCGLSPILIDMMERGFIDAIAMNGAGAVHDLEIAYHGATSEDVATEIKSGRFGMVEQTGAHFNKALTAGDTDDGMGAALGKYMVANKMPNNNVSLLARAWELDKPVTVHVAIGTDIVHIHPGVDGAMNGRATMNDFRLFTGIVGELKGGVYLNIGSAVILPEVFIKALSAARNLGHDVSGFMTVNLDMIQHYRPSVNVVNRPIQGAGEGISITGHHEIMVPLIYHMLMEDQP